MCRQRGNELTIDSVLARLKGTTTPIKEALYIPVQSDINAAKKILEKLLHTSIRPEVSYIEETPIELIDV